MYYDLFGVFCWYCRGSLFFLSLSCSGFSGSSGNCMYPCVLNVFWSISLFLLLPVHNSDQEKESYIRASLTNHTSIGNKFYCIILCVCKDFVFYQSNLIQANCKVPFCHWYKTAELSVIIFACSRHFGPLEPLMSKYGSMWDIKSCIYCQFFKSNIFPCS